MNEIIKNTSMDLCNNYCLDTCVNSKSLLTWNECRVCKYILFEFYINEGIFYEKYKRL